MDVTVVKWGTPAEEVAGIAAVAAALVARREVPVRRVGFAAPNRTWAAQMARACHDLGLRVAVADGPLPSHERCAPIMDVRRVEGDFDWLFLFGCTDGLLPEGASLAEALDHARQSAILSYFTAIDAALARQIHLPVLRTKSLNGTSVATCRPTRFLSALGDGRPSTIGGQALLRAHGLN